jgi:hypothetical protein
VYSPTVKEHPDLPCLKGQPVAPETTPIWEKYGPMHGDHVRNAEGNAGQPAFTLRQHWGATKSGRGHQKHATYSISFESYTLNTGESARDVKESGK